MRQSDARRATDIAHRFHRAMKTKIKNPFAIWYLYDGMLQLHPIRTFLRDEND